MIKFPISPPFPLFRPQQIGWCTPALVRAISLSRLSIQILIFSRKTLIETTRNNVLPVTWASFNLIMLTHKFNKHNYEDANCPSYIYIFNTISIKIIFTIYYYFFLGLFKSHINFRISLTISVKEPVRILIRSSCSSRGLRTRLI